VAADSIQTALLLFAHVQLDDGVPLPSTVQPAGRLCVWLVPGVTSRVVPGGVATALLLLLLLLLLLAVAAVVVLAVVVLLLQQILLGLGHGGSRGGCELNAALLGVLVCGLCAATKGVRNQERRTLEGNRERRVKGETETYATLQPVGRKAPVPGNCSKGSRELIFRHTISDRRAEKFVGSIFLILIFSCKKATKPDLY
jgi:hypothetical protein